MPTFGVWWFCVAQGKIINPLGGEINLENTCCTRAAIRPSTRRRILQFAGAVRVSVCISTRLLLTSARCARSCPPRRWQACSRRSMPQTTPGPHARQASPLPSFCVSKVSPPLCRRDTKGYKRERERVCVCLITSRGNSCSEYGPKCVCVCVFTILKKKTRSFLYLVLFFIWKGNKRGTEQGTRERGFFFLEEKLFLHYTVVQKKKKEEEESV